MPDKCFFSHDIAEGLTCSDKPDFDDNGFPEFACVYFPCLRFKALVLGERILDLDREGKYLEADAAKELYSQRFEQ